MRETSVYQIINITAGSARTTEPLGTKYKFWYQDAQLGLALFKEGRPGTGENWAERIACELAAAIHMPHALYEFATYEGRSGVVTRSLVDRRARVVHGNELLAAQITNYVPQEALRYRNPNHTLRRVVAYLRGGGELIGAPYGWPQTERIRSPLDFFIGYLMFDTWIGNQDRHDQNWGVLRMNDGNLFLAPSFDHGSSMARNEPDERRLLRLTTKDMPRHVSSFVRTARSGFFPSVAAPNTLPLYTLDAFVQIASQSKRAADEWRQRLEGVTQESVRAIINHVPAEWMSEPAREFTAELLRLNRERILSANLA